jgi:hypothetical protein
MSIIEPNEIKVVIEDGNVEEKVLNVSKIENNSIDNNIDEKVNTNPTTNINNENTNRKLNSFNSIKNNINIKALIFSKQTLLELEFSKMFKMVTTSVEYKENVFYKKVKLVLESNKIMAFDYEVKKKKNNANSNELINPLLVLNFDQVTACVSVKPNSNKFCIYVLGSSKVFKFRIINKPIFYSVLLHLNYYIESSLGNKTNLLGISLRDNFHKVN